MDHPYRLAPQHKRPRLKIETEEGRPRITILLHQYAVNLPCEIVDVCLTEICIRYQGAALSAGTEVDVVYKWGRLNGKVVSTKKLGEHSEVGLRIAA